MENLQLNIIEETSSPQDNVVITAETTKKPSKFKKFWQAIRPAVIPFIIFIIVQELSWSGNMFLGKDGVAPMIWLDKQIPVISQFIWVYYLTFPVAIFCFFWAGAKDKKHMWNIWLTATICFAISGIVYFFWQTQMVLKPTDFVPVTLSDKFMVWTWGTCKPINCLPSQHCLMAIFITLCLYNQKNTTPLCMRISGYVLTVLIFMATLFLRQHYILDLVAALVIALPCYLIVKACKFGDWAENKRLKKEERKKQKDLQ